MSIIVRKLRLQRGWTQDQLAEFAGLSVQRIERGAEASLESLKALAAVLEVDLATLQNGDRPMQTDANTAAQEKEALEFVKGIREFYMHLFMYLVFAAVFLGAFGARFGFGDSRARMMVLAFAGWGIGLIVHGLTCYEVIRFLGPKWERAVVEKRLGRSL